MNHELIEELDWCIQNGNVGPRSLKALCAARAHLAALESAEKEAVPVAWQPIETAPQTGRTLLLGYLNAAGKWRTVRGQWMSEAYIAESWEEPDDVEPGWFETSVEADWPPNCWRIKPTHWMPLPAAPAALSQKVGDQK